MSPSPSAKPRLVQFKGLISQPQPSSKVLPIPYLTPNPTRAPGSHCLSLSTMLEPVSAHPVPKVLMPQNRTHPGT